MSDPALRNLIEDSEAVKNFLHINSNDPEETRRGHLLIIFATITTGAAFLFAVILILARLLDWWQSGFNVDAVVVALMIFLGASLTSILLAKSGRVPAGSYLWVFAFALTPVTLALFNVAEPLGGLAFGLLPLIFGTAILLGASHAWMTALTISFIEGALFILVDADIHPEFAAGIIILNLAVAAAVWLVSRQLELMQIALDFWDTASDAPAPLDLHAPTIDFFVDQLSTPLMTMQGSIERMMQIEYGSPEDYHRIANLMRSAVWSAQNTVIRSDRMLEYVLKRDQVNITEFDPSDLILSIISRFRETTAEKDIRLRCLIQPTTPSSVRSSVIHLQHALVEIVRNALDRTAEGTVEISARSSQDGFWEIYITDTGSGIPEDLLERVQEPFVYAGDSVFRPGRHVGLGLTIARAAIERIGGTMQIESVVGQGTCVSIIIPLESHPPAERAL